MSSACSNQSETTNYAALGLESAASAWHESSVSTKPRHMNSSKMTRQVRSRTTRRGLATKGTSFMVNEVSESVIQRSRIQPRTIPLLAQGPQRAGRWPDHINGTTMKHGLEWVISKKVSAEKRPADSPPFFLNVNRISAVFGVRHQAAQVADSEFRVDDVQRLSRFLLNDLERDWPSAYLSSPGPKVGTSSLCHDHTCMHSNTPRTSGLLGQAGVIQLPTLFFSSDRLRQTPGEADVATDASVCATLHACPYGHPGHAALFQPEGSRWCYCCIGTIDVGTLIDHSHC